MCILNITNQIEVPSSRHVVLNSVVYSSVLSSRETAPVPRRVTGYVLRTQRLGSGMKHSYAQFSRLGIVLVIGKYCCYNSEFKVKNIFISCKQITLIEDYYSFVLPWDTGVWNSLVLYHLQFWLHLLLISNNNRWTQPERAKPVIIMDFCHPSAQELHSTLFFFFFFLGYKDISLTATADHMPSMLQMNWPGKGRVRHYRVRT